MTASNTMRRAKIRREIEGYLELGMPEQAQAALARLGDPTGFDPHLLYLWGEALRAMERYDEALLPLGQAADAMRDDVHVRLAMAWCYKRIGRIDRAIGALEQALAVEPGDALLRYNLACYWSLAGDLEQALYYLSDALAIEPRYLGMIDDEPDFDPIRSDPDFRTLCAGVELA
ncbi:MAG: tetratricopeptide repeat protein [Candidatus Nealsonbacteria bacterium]|nr:tetratricopeptide repeat protein [Candidatus Nealsonbacteria bacterium]